jgi:hypothetical protein
MISDAGAVTPVAKGTAKITLRGTTGTVGSPDTDGLGQFAEIEFTVTIN